MARKPDNEGDQNRVTGQDSRMEGIPPRSGEESYRGSEATYRAIFDAANDAIFVHDIQTGAILDVNRRMTEMYGYSVEEARHLNVEAISAGTSPYTQKDALEWLRKAAQGEPQLFEWLCKDKNGRLFWVEVNIKRATINGQDRLLALVRDISDRKRAEEERLRLLDELRELNQRLVISGVQAEEQARAMEELTRAAQGRAAELEAILDNMVDGVFVCDAEGRITLANEAGLKLLGLENLEEAKRFVGELSTRLLVRRWDGSALILGELPLIRALAGQVVEMEDEILYNHSTKRDAYVRTNASPIHDAEGRVIGAVAAVRDVTQSLELERLRDQFVSVAAHELKTPVAAMKGYAQALLRQPQILTERQRLGLATIDRQADRIARLVEDLLDISRFQTGALVFRRERIDLVALARPLIQRMAAMAKNHLVLEAPEPIYVEGDRDRLEQVLRNLLDNAIKYSPQGGEVRVRMTEQDGKAVVSITDQGVGIPRRDQERIFERFYRAHAGTPYDFGGMGVGLYICREIITRHGGELWFESEEGKGSSFYFSLPRA